MPPQQRTRTNRDTDDYTKKSFELLLMTLRDKGANPHRLPTRPGVLSAACVLDTCKTSSPTSLTLDGQTAHYHCNACEADGSPTTYIARLWGVSASNAHALIDHYSLDDMKNGRPAMTPEMLEHRQDTYPLGVAMTHYKKLVPQSFAALQWLTKLAVTPDTAHKANVGFSDGENLRQHLLNHNVTEEQMLTTQLLSPSTGEERFAGNIVIGDADHTGAITWLISTNPTRDINIPGYRISPNPPPINAIPFRGRTALVGIQRTYDRTKPALLTDDVRAYLAALAHGAQSILLVHRTRNEPPAAQQSRLDSVAKTVDERTRMSSLVILTHHSPISSGLQDRLQTLRPTLPVLAAGKAMTLRVASPATRNMDTLFAADTFQDRAKQARAQMDSQNTPPDHQGETSQESQEETQ